MITITSPPPTAANSPEETTETTGLCTLPTHIIESHVLTRLDGPTLASASSCSAALRQLSSHNHLWTELCHRTWPSTTSSRITHTISSFPGGPRAFFSSAFTNASQTPISTGTAPPPELISAVDILYNEKSILSKHQETETVSDWFRCSPFRVDLLGPKEFVPTPIKHPKFGDETSADIINNITLSWILIDPIGRRAVNLSSRKPVAVQRHWLTGEVKIKFASILAAENGHVLCSAAVTCSGSECGEMQVMEVSLEMEDMEGAHLNGNDSLVILHGTLEGKRGIAGKLRYEDYVQMRQERKERKVKTEEALDMFCLGFGAFILVAFLLFLYCRET